MDKTAVSGKGKTSRAGMIAALFSGAALGAAGIASLCGGFRHDSESTTRADYSAPLENKVSSAEDIFRNFPETIAGAYSAEKVYPCTGAKYCLVNIRQRHLPPKEAIRPIRDEQDLMGFKIAYANEARLTNFVQKDIYSILAYLIENHKLSEVRHEGRMTDMSSDEADKYYKDLLKGTLMNSLPSAEAIKQALSDREFMQANFHYAPGAALLFAREGRLKIRGAEEGEVHKRAREELKETKKISMETHKAREDALIRLAATPDNPNPMRVFIYGGDHDWIDNIKEWNQAHPNEMFNFVVITPNSLKILDGIRNKSD